MTEDDKENTIPWWYRRKAVKIAAYSAIVLVAYVAITAVFVEDAAENLEKIQGILLAYIAACKALLAWYIYSKKDPVPDPPQDCKDELHDEEG